MRARGAPRPSPASGLRRATDIALPPAVGQRSRPPRGQGPPLAHIPCSRRRKADRPKAAQRAGTPNSGTGSGRGRCRCPRLRGAWRPGRWPEAEVGDQRQPGAGGAGLVLAWAWLLAAASTASGVHISLNLTAGPAPCLHGSGLCGAASQSRPARSSTLPPAGGQPPGLLLRAEGCPPTAQRAPRACTHRAPGPGTRKVSRELCACGCVRTCVASGQLQRAAKQRA